MAALPESITPGQVAYTAYVLHCGGKSIHGEDLPNWDGQAPEIRGHWEWAAKAVLWEWAAQAVLKKDG